MSVFSRLSDIINANITHMLDQAEDPVKMMRLMIQEMEDTLVEVKYASAKTFGEKKTLERNLNEAEMQIEKWQQRAVLALENSKEDLARQALAEKSKLESDRDLIIGNLSDVSEECTKLEVDIQKLEKKMNETRDNYKKIVTKQEAQKSRKKTQDTLLKAEHQSAFAKIDRVQREMDRVESLLDLNSSKSDLNDQFEELEQKSKVDQELAALKAKIGKSS